MAKTESTRREFFAFEETKTVPNPFMTRDVEYIHVCTIEIIWFGEEGLARRLAKEE